MGNASSRIYIYAHGTNILESHDTRRTRRVSVLLSDTRCDGRTGKQRERENRYENPSRDGSAINACRRRRTRRRVDNACILYVSTYIQ